ncbi:MAG: DUF4386 family protein [Candidatus Hodarchaeales archaeon]
MEIQIITTGYTKSDEIEGYQLNQVIPLERRECARNAGIAMTARVSILFFILLALNTIFQIPDESTLPAINNLKTNGLLVLVLVVSILIMAFAYLPNIFSLNNVFSAVNKDISLGAAIFRLLEGIFLIIGIIFLFFEFSFFTEVFFINYIFYALNLILISYLVFKSGYLDFSRIPFLGGFLAFILILGGSTGYLFSLLTHFYAPSLIWTSSIGLMVAMVAEIALGFTLVMKARELMKGRTDPKKTIIFILEDLGEASTEEIIEKASKISRDCKDRIPRTLKTLEKDKKITKAISKEKRAIVWTLAS